MHGLDKLGLDIEVLLMFQPKPWGENWTCRLKRETGETKVEVSTKSEDMGEAIEHAIEKWRAITRDGKIEDFGRLLEAPRAKPEPYEPLLYVMPNPDDDIPF